MEKITNAIVEDSNINDDKKIISNDLMHDS